MFCVRCGAGLRLGEAIDEAWRFRADADRRAREALRALCVPCALKPGAPAEFDHRFCVECGRLLESRLYFEYGSWDNDGRNTVCGYETTFGCF